MTQPASLRSRPIFWISAVILALVVAGGAYGLWYLFLKPSGPPPVNISTVPVPSVSPATAVGTLPAASATTAAASQGATAAETTSAAPAASSGSSTAAGVDGTWKVDQSLGSFSDFTSAFVGYRVQEQLATIGANTAVGRTPDVTGQMTIQGTNVTAADFAADLTTLQSDDDRRDGQLRRQGIQTAQFPNATFKLTSPIDLGSIPPDGQSVSVTALGDFTLHGITKSVGVPIEAKRSGDVIVVTGSLPILFSDYGIDRPNSFAVLSIDDHGTMEFQLLFTRG